MNLFKKLDKHCYDVDFLVLNQVVYKNATSLMGEIPDWIHVYDLVKLRSKNQLNTVLEKIRRRLFHVETYGREGAKLLRGKRYDAAFSFGEWLSPQFVANYVRADKKYVWIHIDLDKAEFVNKAEFAKYDAQIAGYIFPSKTSKEGSEKCCPEMKGKGFVVHNFLDEQDILKKAHQKLPKKYQEQQPYILSVGNLRVEKNYPRQVAVMAQLKNQGVQIKWLCVGSTVDKNVVPLVREKIRQAALQDDFILCGADDNPYRYMKRAEAVMVLSDFESWSLVITEAKLLGIPVIATNTSGAREQLKNDETGIVTGFEVDEIAQKTRTFLTDKELQRKIRENLKREDVQNFGLEEFEMLVKV